MEKNKANIVYVRDFREAREIAKSPNPLYIGDAGDLFRLHGLWLDENSPPIYVSQKVPTGLFLEMVAARFHSLAKDKPHDQ